jgi:hypothetical protein
MSRIVWGAAEIGKVVGRTEKQIYYIVEKRMLKSIRRLGGRLCADADRLLAEIAGDEFPERRLTAREMLDGGGSLRDRVRP